jgi:RHH-type transcriptional regulator, rel operon repressor / antitoxin RelB
MLALRLPKDIEDRLEALARRTGRTKSYYARKAIIEFIDDLEDVLDAEDVLAASSAEYVTLDQVKAELAADLAKSRRTDGKKAAA